jgi:isopentenyl diphosphate isomerase/L-lactate dehydrogenase-like FMN-dependent dehydrogenase
MVDVSDVNMTTHVPALGLRNLAAPILIAPVAMQRAAHPDGECAAARACAAHSVPYCASQQSTTAIEEIGRAGGDGPKMFQLYVLSDRDATAKLIRRAETMGATAMCITVDAPVLGRRERDVRNRFKLKAGLKLVNVENAKNEKNAKNADNQTKSAVDAKRAQSAIARRIGGRDASLSWDHLTWLRTVTKLPIVLKGICTYADAKLATQAGVAAVWVSNHGGRQLDGSAATLDALPEVVAGVAGKCPVIFDGGVRRGSDVLKALALGADLVAVGRPCAWGLACGGEVGVGKALELLTEELRVAMTLAGCVDVKAARRGGLVQRLGEKPPRCRL